MAMLHGDALASRGDQHQFADALRLRDGPFDGLKSAHRTSDQARRCGPMPRASASRMCARTMSRIVKGGKSAVVRCAGLRIRVKRSRRAVVRAEDVGADDEMTRRIEEFPRFDRVRPPVRDVRIGRQRMAYPHHVVVRGVQFAVGVIGDLQLRQRVSRFQLERFGGYVNAGFHYRCFSASFRSSFMSSICSMPSESRSMLG